MPVPADWHALDAALEHALDLAPEDREAYVASLEAPLRDGLRPLLRDACQEDPLLDRPAEVRAVLAEPAGAAPLEGLRLGAYRLGEVVGEGGMGRVYRAARADGAFEQTVAVKVVRPSWAVGGGELAARLTRERAVLAGLDHPGIARLLDGGETPDGLPYLVTEYVDGLPLLEHAERAALGVRERVALMAAVARAVDHAHRRAVVHRDLKPSNVLVTEQDGRPRPVVLDFGIAKLLAGPDDAAVTLTGHPLLTPAYAAPEQFEPGGEITTAIDVYGLGALLYELLTGERPHPTAPVPTRPTTAPRRPSRAAGDRAGRGDPGLRGDLDVICLKALQPEPARRYASAAAFADDLERYLDGRPVQARPESLAYLALRFAQRNRAAVAAGLVAVAALVGGFASTAVALRNERAARQEVEAAAARANEASALLGGLFEAADPVRTGGREVSVREALDAGRARVAAVESDVLRGYLLGVLGKTYLQVGEVQLADSLLDEAVAVLHATLEAPLHLRVRATIDLAKARLRLGKPGATALYRDALATATAAEADSLRLLALDGLTYAYYALRQPRQALAASEDYLRTARADGRPLHEGGALRGRGLALMAAGRHREAEGQFAEGLALTERALGRDHELTNRLALALAASRMTLGEPAAAEELYVRGLAHVRRTLGTHHPTVSHALATLGLCWEAQGEYRRAAAAFDSSIVILEGFYPPDHVEFVGLHLIHARALNEAGAHREAAEAARKGLAVRAARPPGQTPTPWAHLGFELGDALVRLGRTDEARPLIRRVAEAMARPGGEELFDERDAARVRRILAAIG